MLVRRLILAGFLLIGLIVEPSGAAPRVRPFPLGKTINWSLDHDGSPARYQVGTVALTLLARHEGKSRDMVTPLLTIRIPGYAPVQMKGSSLGPSYEHRFAVGPWDSKRPFVLFQSFTGGAHCCNAVQVAYPDKNQLRLGRLGEWDGDYLDDLPVDRNGDGRLDFIFRDDSFLYTFTSYADSWSPPQVMNIVAGRPVDVSADPGFRPLFHTAMLEERNACLGLDKDFADRNPNGACAAYVASAARVGQFDTAWAEMLKAYDRKSHWDLPYKGTSYPQALRRFLIEHKYIRR